MIKIGDLMEHYTDTVGGKPMLGVLLEDNVENPDLQGFRLLVLILNRKKYDPRIVYPWRDLSYWRKLS